MGKQNPSHKSNEQTAPVNDEAIQEEIRRLAYELFCECGYERGHDLEHWVEAERKVLERLRNE